MVIFLLVLDIRRRMKSSVLTNSRMSTTKTFTWPSQTTMSFVGLTCARTTGPRDIFSRFVNLLFIRFYSLAIQKKILEIFRPVFSLKILINHSPLHVHFSVVYGWAIRMSLMRWHYYFWPSGMELICVTLPVLRTSLWW